MKFAYLILAHNEFSILQRLVTALDDNRNDIFIHYDKKVKSLPSITTEKSHLYIIEDRIDSLWGDETLVRAEIALMKAARCNNRYDYYHIISGVHFPLKSQDYIHSFFEKHSGKSVLFPMETTKEEIEMKFGLYHFFLRHLISKNEVVRKVDHFLWLASLKIQKGFIKRDVSWLGSKASQWCSLSNDAVESIIKNERFLDKHFYRTFCCDEFFIATMLRIDGIMYDEDMRILYADFLPYTPKTIEMSDYESLVSSECLFARKFTAKHIDIIDKLEYIIQ